MKKILLLGALIFTLSYASLSVAIMPGAGQAQMRNNAQIMQQNKEQIRLQQRQQNYYYPKSKKYKRYYNQQVR